MMHQAAQSAKSNKNKNNNNKEEEEKEQKDKQQRETILDCAYIYHLQYDRSIEMKRNAVKNQKRNWEIQR